MKLFNMVDFANNLLASQKVFDNPYQKSLSKIFKEEVEPEERYFLERQAEEKEIEDHYLTEHENL